MKRIKIIIIIFLLVNIFTLQDCYADLTSTQQENIKRFTISFVEKGLNKKDNNGYPLLAYMQGQARIDGYQGKLHYVSKDYQSINSVNGSKWTFDCASFVSYIYKQVFNLVLTKNAGSGIDSYSKLPLMSANANPYTVSNFVDNADNNKHFYYIQQNVTANTINYKIMQPGDLVIIKGSHIMMYIGDGKIAHTSSSSITKNKELGFEICDLSTRYPDRKFYVIRIKNNVISPSNTGNTKVVWPDTNTEEDLFGNNSPTIVVETDNQGTFIDLNITFDDDKGLAGYQITNTNNVPTTWTTINGQKTFNIKHTINENNTYYIYVKDAENKVTYEVITTKNIDNDKPVINNVQYSYNFNETFNITISTTDNNKVLYSLDGILYQQNNIFNNIKKGNYTLYVKDTYNNITSQNINLTDESIPKITVNYNQEYTKKLLIQIAISSNFGIKGFKITKDSNSPENYDSYSNSINYTIDINGTYYIWAISNNNIPFAQKIVINNIDDIPPIIEKVKISNNILLGTTFKIIASDNQSGIIGYSIDGVNYQEKSVFKNKNDNVVNVYVKDKCGNVGIYTLNNVKQSNNIMIILIPLIVLLIIICIIYKKRKRK